MSNNKPRATVEELFELLKRTELPTVLVEGKDDIIFYRRIEENLSEVGVDILPAGNKHAVLQLRDMLSGEAVKNTIVFIVDNDLWVHTESANDAEELITSEGYSVENDIFSDGELCELMSAEERATFDVELERFVRWYALAVSRQLRGLDCEFRTHPTKVLDESEFYEQQLKLFENETYPDGLYSEIVAHYPRLLRGKSLFALLQRQLSKGRRRTKFGTHQLMEIGAARKGEKFERICNLVRTVFVDPNVRRTSS